jgi:uncharacterized membrane-anchored protein YhcB (DUF1043 family)
LDLLTFIAIIVVGAPIAKAVANRISRQPVPGDPRLRELLEHAEQQLEEAEQRLAEHSERLADMEERLDFTERMLARHNARDQLGP